MSGVDSIVPRSRHIDRGGGWHSDTRNATVRVRVSIPPSLRGRYHDLGLRLMRRAS